MQPLKVRDVRLFHNLSFLEQQRLKYQPSLPAYLRGALRAQVEPIHPTACISATELALSFPVTFPETSAVQLVPMGKDRVFAPASAEPSTLRVGVIFASNQVPGFHTVVAGLFDYFANQERPFQLIGFTAGFEGLIKNHT